MRIMTLQQKVNKAKDNKINLPNDILNRKVVGVYGVFAKNSSEEFCFYIGKTTNMCSRLLDSSNGHIHLYLYNRKNKLVPRVISELIKQGYEIDIRILEEVNYEDTSFSRAAHRLALAELNQIVKYQNKEQCLDQLPEGVGKKEKIYWEENYKKDGNKTIF